MKKIKLIQQRRIETQNIMLSEPHSLSWFDKINSRDNKSRMLVFTVYLPL